MTITSAQAKAIAERAFLNFGISQSEYEDLNEFIDRARICEPVAQGRYADDWMHRLGQELRDAGPKAFL